VRRRSDPEVAAEQREALVGDSGIVEYDDDHRLTRRHRNVLNLAELAFWFLLIVIIMVAGTPFSPGECKQPCFLATAYPQPDKSHRVHIVEVWNCRVKNVIVGDPERQPDPNCALISAFNEWTLSIKASPDYHCDIFVDCGYGARIHGCEPVKGLPKQEEVPFEATPRPFHAEDAEQWIFALVLLIGLVVLSLYVYLILAL
jgi:hypothetical protein